MGVRCLAQNLFAIEELLQLRNRVKEKFSKNGTFNDFNSEKIGHGEYIKKGQLPDLSLVKGISFVEFFIISSLPSKEKSLNYFIEILSGAEKNLQCLEKINVKVSFEEKNSQQTMRFSDSVFVGFSKGKKFYDYTAFGSKVSKDINYKINFFNNIISELNLPIAINHSDDGFSLHHTGQGELTVTSCNLHYKNPSSFTCEVYCESILALFSLLERTLKNHGSGKCFEYTWSVLIGDLVRKRDDCAEVLDGYEMLRAQNFPAEKCDITFAYYLDEIEGIETLRGLCGAKKNFLTEICSFTLPNKNSATLTAETCSEGHRLELYLSDSDDLSKIEEKLGLKFIECQE